MRCYLREAMQSSYSQSCTSRVKIPSCSNQSLFSLLEGVSHEPISNSFLHTWFTRSQANAGYSVIRHHFGHTKPSPRWTIRFHPTVAKYDFITKSKAWVNFICIQINCDQRINNIESSTHVTRPIHSKIGKTQLLDFLFVLPNYVNVYEQKLPARRK